MRFFTKTELGVVLTTLFIIGSFSYFNFQVSFRKSRDSQRREDLGAVYNALNDFKRDFGFFPPNSSDGRIIACKGDNFDEVVEKLRDADYFDLNVYLTGLKPCDWGWDSLKEFSNNQVYMASIPTDPLHQKGYRYYYVSNLNRFQIFASLEGSKVEIGYSSAILDRQLNCGISICNTGRAYSTTPLEITLEEYENELVKIKNESSKK